jgi:hypothetical protein
MLYVVLTMPTLNKAYLFIYLFIYSFIYLISVGKCELYSEKYSYHSSEIYGLNRVL